MSFYSTDPLTAGRTPAEAHGRSASNMVAYMHLLTAEGIAGTLRWVRCDQDADGAIRLFRGEMGTAMLETDLFIRPVPLLRQSTVPASAAGIHGVFTKHHIDLEADGDRPGVYVRRFDNGTCLNVDGPEPRIVGLMQATRFDWHETVDSAYSHIRNGRGEETEVVSFRLARKLDLAKLRDMIAQLEMPVAA